MDFEIQPIIPHMHSQLGPGMAVGDINGDNLEDVYIGGASGQSGIFFCKPLIAQDLSGRTWALDSMSEDMGALFFDVEGDGDNDLYVVSGGTSHPKGTLLFIRTDCTSMTGKVNFQSLMICQIPIAVVHV